jgi:hypothetical protein
VLLLGTGTLAFLCLFAVAVLRTQRPSPLRHIDRVTFEKIRTGMTSQELAALLGPPGDYRTGPSLEDRAESSYHIVDDSEGTWICDACCINVYFDSGGKVFVKHHHGLTPDRWRFLDRIRRLLPW